jgi:low temperature requirement protein LtrA
MQAVEGLIQRVGQSSLVQNVAGKTSDMVPQIKMYHLVEKIIFGIIIALCIILIFVSIALFAKHKTTAGIWVMGAAVGLGSFALWWKLHFEKTPVQPKYGAAEHKKEHKEFEDVGLDDFKPEEWTE